MQSNYILKTSNNEILNFYYGKEKAIYCKRFNQNNYSSTIKIIQEVSDCFSVSLGKDDYIYIVCRELDGNIVLLKMSDNDIEKHPLFNEGNENFQNALFYPVFYKNNINLIFNSSFMSNQNGYLSIKSLLDNHTWSKTQNIDLLYPFANTMYKVQAIDSSHLILAYQKKGKDIQIGYKEIKDGAISDFIQIHNTAYQIVDYSFVYYNEEVHYIYVLKNLFSSQVIYKKKNSNGFSSPIVLFEGQKVKSCNVSVLDGELFCSFVIGNTLYYSKSENMGFSFLNVAKYRKNITQEVIKAKYISANESQGISEIYVDTKNQLNIYLLPEFLQEFFSYNEQNQTNTYIQSPMQATKQNFVTSLNGQVESPKPIEKEKPTIIIEQTRNHNLVPVEQDFMSNFNLEEFANFTSNIRQNAMPKTTFEEQIQSTPVLKTKLDMLNEQLEEKNSQILKLNSIIQNKNNEKTEVEIQLRKKLKMQDEELNNLKEILDNERKETRDIKETIKLLEEENLTLKAKINEEENISAEKQKQSKKENKKT